MKFIINKYKVIIPIHVIKDTMWRILNLSFKKGKLRPIRIDYMKQSFAKCLFVVRVVKEINNFSVLINIDGTSFSRATNSAFSWLEKGKEWILGNIWWSKSVLLITTILSTGSMYEESSSTFVNGGIFADILKSLKVFIQEEIKKKKNWLILFE